MTPTRIRWLVPDVNPRRASLRYRCLYPVAELRRRGLDVAVVPDETAFGADLALVIDAWSLFPGVHADGAADRLVETALRAARAGSRVVVDNCDNQWHAQPTATWRAALDRLGRVCGAASTIVCCSQALADVMRGAIAGSAEFAVIDDPIEDAIVYPDDAWWRTAISWGRKRSWLTLQAHRWWLAAGGGRQRTAVVWFGSHGNNFAPGGMLDLLQCKPLLEAVNQTQPISLTVISNHQAKFDENFADWRLPVRYLPWDRTTFIAALQLHAICLIPAQDNPFTRCKSSNRLVMAANLGLNVLADPVPSYMPYAAVADIGDWPAQLPALLRSSAERRARAVAARALVRQRNGLPTIGDQWQAVLCGPPATHGASATPAFARRALPHASQGVKLRSDSNV